MAPKKIDNVSEEGEESEEHDDDEGEGDEEEDLLEDAGKQEEETQEKEGDKYAAPVPRPRGKDATLLLQSLLDHVKNPTDFDTLQSLTEHRSTFLTLAKARAPFLRSVHKYQPNFAFGKQLIKNTLKKFATHRAREWAFGDADIQKFADDVINNVQTLFSKMGKEKRQPKMSKWVAEILKESDTDAAYPTLEKEYYVRWDPVAREVRRYPEGEPEKQDVGTLEMPEGDEAGDDDVVMGVWADGWRHPVTAVTVQMLREMKDAEALLQDSKKNERWKLTRGDTTIKLGLTKNGGGKQFWQILATNTNVKEKQVLQVPVAWETLTQQLAKKYIECKVPGASLIIDDPETVATTRVALRAERDKMIAEEEEPEQPAQPDPEQCDAAPEKPLIQRKRPAAAPRPDVEDAGGTGVREKKDAGARGAAASVEPPKSPKRRCVAPASAAAKGEAPATSAEAEETGSSTDDDLPGESSFDMLCRARNSMGQVPASVA